ncbi:hypothetical protein C8J57DRAFT_1630201, partial [Mycena rebaudengoi]
MSAIFPRRGRREDSDASYVDLSPPPPITEKRHHSLSRICEFASSPKARAGLQKILRHSLRCPHYTEITAGTALTHKWRLGARKVEGQPGLQALSLPTSPRCLHAMSPPAGLAHHEVASRTITATGVAGTLHMDKAKVAAKVGPLITMGLQNMTRAQTVVSEVVSSQAWSVVKTQAQAILAPAKDILLILDSVTKYIPALMSRNPSFPHELDKRENDKNILVVYHTMVIFKAADQIKASLDTFFEAVGKTMQDFGNFRDVYYRHNHFGKATITRQLAMVNNLFSASASIGRVSAKAYDFCGGIRQSQEQSPVYPGGKLCDKVNEMSGTVDTMSAKLDMVLQFISRQTPLEQSVTKQLEEHGGFEKALQNTEFLNNLSRSTFHEDLSPQVQATLGQGLEDALKANLPMFTLKVEAAQREMEES